MKSINSSFLFISNSHPHPFTPSSLQVWGTPSTGCVAAPSPPPSPLSGGCRWLECFPVALCPGGYPKSWQSPGRRPVSGLLRPPILHIISIQWPKPTERAVIQPKKNTRKQKQRKQRKRTRSCQSDAMFPASILCREGHVSRGMLTM